MGLFDMLKAVNIPPPLGLALPAGAILGMRCGR